MAIFLQGENPSVVWNKKTDRPLFQFQKRVLETESKTLIELLIKKGYKMVKEDFPDSDVTLRGNVKGVTTVGAPEGKPVRLSRKLKKNEE